MIIYLVRHGQASFDAENYDQLSELGIEQAQLVGKSLAKQNVVPDAIFQGSMHRHHQTALHSLPGYACDADVTTLAQWNEYDHREILAKYDERLATPKSTKAYITSQPQPMKFFQELFVAAIARWTSGKYDDDYHETWQVFRARVLEGLELVQRSGHKSVVVYSSGGPISLVSSLLLGLPLEDFMRINWTLVNGSITKLISSHGTNQLMLSSLNEHTIFSELDSRKYITYT